MTAPVWIVTAHHKNGNATEYISAKRGPEGREANMRNKPTSDDLVYQRIRPPDARPMFVLVKVV